MLNKTQTNKKKIPPSLLADILALAFLTLCVLLFFWPIITQKAWLPRGGGDLVSFIYPMYRFNAHSFWQGELPLWNPTLYAGMPHIGDNQSGAFYPFNLLLYLFNPNFSYAAIEGLVILHSWLAGVWMYLTVRLWRAEGRIGVLPALTAAIGFMFSGLFITHLGNLNLNAVISWLPLATLLLHRAMAEEDRRRAFHLAAGSGGIIAVSTLAGHGQMTFMLGLFLGLFGVSTAVFHRSLRPLLLLLTAGVIGIGGSAVAILPALEMIPHTARAAFDLQSALNYSLPFSGLTGLFSPHFYGRGIIHFWGEWSRVEVGYIGIPILWAAVIGASQSFLPSAKKGDQRPFFVIGAIFFLLLAMGGNTPVYPALLSALKTVPFQVPARFVLLMDFCLAMLAAFGLDEWMNGRLSLPKQSRLLVALSILSLITGITLWRNAVTLGITHPERGGQMETAVFITIALSISTAILITLCRYKPQKRVWWQMGLLLLLAVDLIGQGYFVELEPNNPTLGYAVDSPALAYLQNDTGLHRIDIATGEWQPSLPQLHNLYGIHGVYNPLQLSAYTIYIGAVGYRGAPLYNLLGVKYVIGGKAEPPGDTHFIVPVFDEDPNVTIYLNTRALPRAMVLHNAINAANADEAFAAIHAPDFDPSQTVVVENGVPLTQSPSSAHVLPLRYDLNHAEFEVTTDQPGYFFLSDSYDEGWETAVDNKKADILRANTLFRAVYLEAGTHHITFDFVPQGWRAGAVISLLTWIILTLISVFPFFTINNEQLTTDN